MCSKRCLLSRIWFNLVLFSRHRLISNISSKLMFEVYSTPRIQSLYCITHFKICILPTTYICTIEWWQKDIPTEYTGQMWNFDDWFKQYYRFILTELHQLVLQAQCKGSKFKFKVQVQWFNFQVSIQTTNAQTQCPGAMSRFNEQDLSCIL